MSGLCNEKEIKFYGNDAEIYTLINQLYQKFSDTKFFKRKKKKKALIIKANP